MDLKVPERVCVISVEPEFLFNQLKSAKLLMNGEKGIEFSSSPITEEWRTHGSAYYYRMVFDKNNQLKRIKIVESGWASKGHYNSTELSATNLIACPDLLSIYQEKQNEIAAKKLQDEIDRLIPQDRIEFNF